MKIHKRGQCEYWYDPKHRCWFAAHVDAAGNLGPSVDAYHRDEIEWLIDQGACEPCFNGSVS